MPSSLLFAILKERLLPVGICVCWFKIAACFENECPTPYFEHMRLSWILKFSSMTHHDLAIPAKKKILGQRRSSSKRRKAANPQRIQKRKDIWDIVWYDLLLNCNMCLNIIYYIIWFLFLKYMLFVLYWVLCYYIVPYHIVFYYTTSDICDYVCIICTCI